MFRLRSLSTFRANLLLLSSVAQCHKPEDHDVINLEYEINLKPFKESSLLILSRFMNCHNVEEPVSAGQLFE
jgi:hypothetical protein